MRLVVHRDIVCRVPQQRLERVLARALRRYRSRRCEYTTEFSLALVSRSTMRRLNGQYRRHDQPTDVLSFNYGEVVICWPVAKTQARHHHLAVPDEVVLLFAHGFLHYLGFDHRTPRDRKQMREAEEHLLGFSGLVDRIEAAVPSQKSQVT